MRNAPAIAVGPSSIVAVSSHSVSWRPRFAGQMSILGQAVFWMVLRSESASSMRGDRKFDSVWVSSTRASRLTSNITLIEAWGSQRSEEHTSELQSLMRISYAVFCLIKKYIKNADAHKTYHQQKHIEHNSSSL